MNNPAEIVIAFFELVEAEFREVKKSLDESVNLKTGALGRVIMRLAGSVALILAAIVLILASVGMLLWSMYLYIGQFTTPPQAALMTGFVTLVAAGILIMVEPLTVKEARARFRNVLDREIAELTPETTLQWIMLSTVTGFISGSLPEYSSEQTRKKMAPLMGLLNAAEKQMKENDQTKTSITE